MIDVSIIIPFYNIEEFADGLIQNVIAQEATYDGLMECLLIDDASTDGGNDTIRRRIGQYQGRRIVFRMLTQPHNLGPSAARNRGIREAQGQYIYFMDGDDSIVPDCIAAMMHKVAEHPGVEMVYAGTRRSDGDTWMSYVGKDLPEYTDDRKKIKIDLLGSEYLTVTCYNKLLLRQRLLADKIFFDEGLLRHEDDLWNNMLAKHVRSIATIARDTYIYNIRPGSLTTTECSKGSMLTRLIVEERIIRAIDEPFRTEQIRRALIQEFHYYLSNDNRDIRLRIGQLHLLMARQCPLRQRFWLWVLSALTRFDRGDHSLPFKAYRRLRHHALK